MEKEDQQPLTLASRCEIFVCAGVRAEKNKYMTPFFFPFFFFSLFFFFKMKEIIFFSINFFFEYQ